MSQSNPITHKCPYCKVNHLETVVTVPYVRGFLLAYQIGHKSYLGCVPCSKKKVWSEVFKSMLLGWFSITALIINPFLIIYNIFQALFLSTRLDKVKGKLKDLGIPDSSNNVDLLEVGYGIAALMIKADGKVEPSEIAAASILGSKIFENFDVKKFESIVGSSEKLPSINDAATLLNSILDDNGKNLILKYLHAIANADGDFAEEEKQMILNVAKIFNVSFEI